MLKVDIPNYLTKGGLWFGAMWFYNWFIESNGMSSKYTLTDSLSFSLSNITA